MILAPWIPAVLVAVGAGILDWRYRRIPNWLTVSGLAAGVAVNTILFRWPGLKAALLGTALGLGLCREQKPVLDAICDAVAAYAGETLNK